MLAETLIRIKFSHPDILQKRPFGFEGFETILTTFCPKIKGSIQKIHLKLKVRLY